MECWRFVRRCHCPSRAQQCCNGPQSIFLTPLLCTSLWRALGCVASEPSSISSSDGLSSVTDPFSSVQFSRSVMSDSLRPHESQHARPPCPSPTPEVHSNSRRSSWCCHPAISSSVVPFSSCPHSLPPSECFQ